MCIVISAIVALIWAIIYSNPPNTLETPTLCVLFCEPPSSNSTPSAPLDPGSIIVLVSGIGLVTPSVNITITASVWATILFKKKFLRRDTGDDNALDKKMLLLPILMSFLVVANSGVTFGISALVGEVLKLINLGVFFGNWANFFANVVSVWIDILHGVSYPVALVYLNTQIQATWKRMLFKRGKLWSRSNRVQPINTTTSK